MYLYASVIKTCGMNDVRNYTDTHKIAGHWINNRRVVLCNEEKRFAERLCVFQRID